MGTQRLLITAIAVLAFVASVIWLILDLAAQGGKALSAGPLIALAVAALLALLTRLPVLLENSGRSRRRTSRRPAYRAPRASRQGGRKVFSEDVDVEAPPEIPPWLKEIASPADSPAEPPPRRAEPEPLATEGELPVTGGGAESAEAEPESPGRLEEMADKAEEAPAAAEPSVPPAAPGAEEPYDLPDFLRRRPDDRVRMAEPEPVSAEPEPAADSAATGEVPAASIRFSAYYPREVKPEDWQPLRAYMFRETAAEDVRADAQAEFGPRTDIRETVREALAPIPEDALVTAIPDLPGFEFDPPQASARFRRDWRRFDFEFRAVDAPLDASADGRITFLVEGVIVADVPLSVYVSQTAGQAVFQPAEAVSPYQAIFCSYSHKDTAIVERVEKASRYFNFRYLRDVTTLRSGEAWNPRLLELIEEADIFQLFWSAHAASSEYVRQEYLHAAALRNSGRKGRYFIRPIRWQEPMPAPPPPELAELHFDLVRELAEES